MSRHLGRRTRRALVVLLLLVPLAWIGRMAVASAAPCAAGQWAGSYYANRNLTGAPAGTRCDAQISFDWSAAGPGISGIGTSQYSVRWTQTISFAAASYTFTATADDGVRVILDGTTIIDGWRDQGATTYHATQSLTAGNHNVDVDYYQNGGSAVVQFAYSAPPPPTPTCGATQWTASYFNNRTLSGTPWVQCENAINYDWGTTGPQGVGVGGSNYSVRWTRTQTFGAGPVNITARADDGIRVYLDGTPVIDHWVDEGPTTYTSSTPVAAGAHAISVEYYQHGGGAVAQVTLAGPPPSAVNCTSIQWKASYFNNMTLAGAPVLERCENAISYDWGTNGPGVAGIGPYNFSVRWARTDNFAAGTTTLTTTADDGVRMYLDGALAIDEWKDEGPTTYTATQPVSSGPHTVMVEYYQNGGGAVIRASYTGGGAPGPLPPPPPGGCTANCQGAWQVLPYQSTVRSIHATVLRTGSVLLVAGSGNNQGNFDAHAFSSAVWNPTTGQMTNLPTPADLFCTGHAQLPNGDILLGGGTAAYPTGTQNYEGLAKSFIFDPATNTYTPVNDMPGGGHWYPSLVDLGTGDVFASGGLNEQGSGNVATEMFDSQAGAWKPLQQVPQTYWFWGLYPQMILMSDGRLFYSGEHTFGDALPNTSGSEIYDINTATITDVSGLRDINERDQGAAVLLPPAQAQKVMDLAGGNSYSNNDPTRHTDIIDLSQPNPAWTAGPDLPVGKMYVSAVILPDGKVFETGGGLHNRADAVHEASMFDPVTGTLTSMPADPQDRMYHSEAFLLPDGRVAALGNNPADGSFDLGISIYSPWYMSVPRPSITSAPTQIDYGSTISLTGSSPVARAVLIKPASVTHSSDPNQRSVDLALSGSGSSVTVTMTTNPNMAPPGYYMLFIQSTSGVPSVAKWVHVG
jgi:galactose oxidase-like protein/PA14 domain-containing protein